MYCGWLHASSSLGRPPSTACKLRSNSNVSQIGLTTQSARRGAWAGPGARPSSFRVARKRRDNGVGFNHSRVLLSPWSESKNLILINSEEAAARRATLDHPGTGEKKPSPRAPRAKGIISVLQPPGEKKKTVDPRGQLWTDGSCEVSLCVSLFLFLLF